jgi:hypothetical protein
MTSKVPPDWTDIAGGFYIDGSWRDIYMVGADGWSALFRMLRRWGYAVAFSISGERASLPWRYAPSMYVGARGENKTYNLEIDIEGLWLRGLFDFDDIVELFLDPSLVKDAACWAALATFIERLGNEAQSPVTLAPENQPDYSFFAYLPFAAASQPWLWEPKNGDESIAQQIREIGARADRKGIRRNPLTATLSPS